MKYLSVLLVVGLSWASDPKAEKFLDQYRKHERVVVHEMEKRDRIIEQWASYCKSLNGMIPDISKGCAAPQLPPAPAPAQPAPATPAVEPAKPKAAQ